MPGHNPISKAVKREETAHAVQKYRSFYDEKKGGGALVRKQRYMESLVVAQNRSGMLRIGYYILNQYRHLTRKMFCPSSVKLLPKRCNGRNSRSASATDVKAASRD